MNITELARKGLKQNIREQEREEIYVKIKENLLDDDATKKSVQETYVKAGLSGVLIMGFMLGAATERLLTKDKP